MSVQVIIFSRDRALQLEAVLHSFYLHCSDASSADVYVLYLATDDRHHHQYRSLAATYSKVAFIPQKNFRQDLLAIMNPFEKGNWGRHVYFALCAVGSVGVSNRLWLARVWNRTARQIQMRLTRSLLPSLESDSYILFLVDDNIFVRDFQLKDPVNALDKHQKLIGCSLRLGTNTVICYPHNASQRLPEFIDINDKLVMYRWPGAEYDFGYPLEVSSSVYRLKDILPFVAGLHFSNPNTLEEQISSHAGVFRSKYPFLCCYRSSITFCNPVNKVQAILPNRAGEQFGYNLEELTDRFERGERIKVEAYNDFTPVGCHQEVELVFEKIHEPV